MGVFKNLEFIHPYFGVKGKRGGVRRGNLNVIGPLVSRNFIRNHFNSDFLVIELHFSPYITLRGEGVKNTSVYDYIRLLFTAKFEDKYQSQFFRKK